MGLPEPLGPPDVGEPDVMLALADGEPLPDVGEVELGTPILEAVDGVPLGFDTALLRFVDDCVDGLATLEPGVLATDDVCEGWEPTELPEGAEGEVPLDDPPPLDTVGEVELGIPILEVFDGALLGFADDCADGLATLESGALSADDVGEGCEPTELPDGAEGDVALDEPTPLDTVGEVELAIPILEPVDGALLGFTDDCADGLATLDPGELATDDA